MSWKHGTRSNTRSKLSPVIVTEFGGVGPFTSLGDHEVECRNFLEGNLGDSGRVHAEGTLFCGGAEEDGGERAGNREVGLDLSLIANKNNYFYCFRK